MLKRELGISGKADRVLPRSARFEPQSSQLCVSIRALTSGNAWVSQTPFFLAFDIAKWQGLCCATELTCLSYNTAEPLVLQVLGHIRKTGLPQADWFVGVSHGLRRHPWDEQELPFATKAWIVIPAATSNQAQAVANKLLGLGFAESPMHLSSPSANFVFAYALSTEFFN